MKKNKLKYGRRRKEHADSVRLWLSIARGDLRDARDNFKRAADAAKDWLTNAPTYYFVRARRKPAKGGERCSE